MMKRVWTARVKSSYRVEGSLVEIELMAQCKSSKAELLRRLTADDPIWARPSVRLSIEPMMAKRHFRRGLAIKADRAPQ